MTTPTLTGLMDRQTQRPSTAPKLVLEPVRESSRLESFPLAPGRYLLGSGPDCDIVIDVGGVAPQHCLMIVGANKTIVKAISPLTWINDGPLSEAVLKLGERLILGPVELRTRRPEVSEWTDLRDEEPSPPPPPVSYQPPQIEELLDQARQQLQTAIDDSPGPVAAWSNALTLTEAVQRHASLPTAVPADQAPAWERMATQRREIDQRELEITERSRAIEYLSTELSSREAMLRSRESEVALRGTHLEQLLTEFSQREQSLAAQEYTLQVRNHAEAAASQWIAEMTRSLGAEQVRLQVLDVSFGEQVSELERQALTLAERTQALELQEAELATRAEVLQRQVPSVQAFVTASPTSPVDTSQVELREAAVAQREARLAHSTAALQATREQISIEAADLEQRFEELIEREQALQRQQSALAQQARQTEARTSEATTQRTGLAEREQAVAASLADLTVREAALQTIKSELDGRDRGLRGLRSELDIREEALNQQFSQLQLDRSALRAAQSKLQLAEQAANQRLVGLDWTSQQRSNEQTAELAEQRTRREQDRSEYLLERQSLEGLRLEIEEQRRQLEQEQSERVLVTASEVNQFEIDNEWQKLAAERARLTAERRDLDLALAALTTQRTHTRVLEPESSEVSEQLLALGSERQSLAELREQLLDEQNELRTERDEIRQTRTQFGQDSQQLLTIKAESVSERDTDLLDRQAVISERQSLQNRERQIQRAEAEIEQLRHEAAQLRTEAETGQNQMTTQRGHLEEEWASLRQERKELKRVESELDVQREELTSLAQQLTDLGSCGEVTTPEPVAAVLQFPPPVPSRRSVDRPQAPAFAPPVSIDIPLDEEDLSATSQSDSAEEALDPLAGFASFSSIGSAIEDELPPEIAEIMRKACGPSPAKDNPPRAKSYSPTVTAPPPPPPPLAPPHWERQNSSIDAREERRRLDLLGRSSESFVEAASARMSDQSEIYAVVADEVISEEKSTWPEDSRDEVIESTALDLGKTELAPETPAPPLPAGPPASELRSRLSEMFGIDLGRLRPPAAPNPDDIDSPPIESPQDQFQPEFSSEREDTEPLTPALDSPAEDMEEEPAAPAAIDEALDPVAAYMEQLLARTRQSKHGHGEKKATPAPKPDPQPGVPMVSKVEPQVIKKESVPSPAKPPRKLEASEKQALRANLDSFREIANTQARSHVARSELRRLSITKKLKQVFLALSGGIALILISTELWATLHYRVEIAASLLALAFLGYDYYRTQARLRELELIAPLEAETDDEDEGGEA